MTENKFMVANGVTGETVSSDFIKPLLKEVKRWIHEGMKFGNFIVLKSENKKVLHYFYDFVEENVNSKCDLCGAEKKAKYMDYVMDEYDVCRVVYCKNCEGEK